ncbi:hypothetical protein E2C01_073667 [Portunus trituberculatus]|uniref:Uncharacterized protein n=1 Tax=Portunus trituberculatus TaxID=210409 RepID=A0A5B7IEI8_PORTR|nr:hypothetical protein [Portunus trituberculatus]
MSDAALIFCYDVLLLGIDVVPQPDQPVNQQHRFAEGDHV